MIYIKKSKKELELLRRKENIETLLKNHLADSHHKFPTTRREFLSAGLQTFSAGLLLPSLSTFFSPSVASAQSSGCASGSAKELPAFITLSCSGGMMLAGQVMPRTSAGQPLNKYTKLGMGGAGTAVSSDLLGVPFWRSSGVLAGINEVITRTGSGFAGKTQLISVPVISTDDNPNNDLDISGLILKAGLKGRFISNIGTRGGSPGKLYHKSALIDPSTALLVSSSATLEASVKLGGILGSNQNGLTLEQQKKLMKTIEDLSKVQGRSLASEGTNGSALNSLLKCATEQNSLLMSQGAQGLNVVRDASQGGEQIRNVWQTQLNISDQLNEGNLSTANARGTMSSIVQAAMTGNAGPVGCVLGGYDYHVSTARSDANELDRQLGRYIGMILAHAELYNSTAQVKKPVVIYIATDGATGTPDADGSDSAQWTGDNGSLSSLWGIFYDPAIKPSLTNKGQGAPWQLGGFVADRQEVDPNYFLAKQPALAAAAIAANYLAFAGLSEAQISQTLGGALSPTQLTEVLRVNKAASA